MSEEFNAGERLYIGYGTSEEERAHRERYEWAARALSSSARVLDSASGSGYGSEILGMRAQSVTGLEINAHALAYARAHYVHRGIEFRMADLNMPLEFSDESFDAVVSFETLEHVRNQEQLLIEFRRVLKPGGMLFISTPDRVVLTDESGGKNRFHIAELSKEEFIALVGHFFEITALYGQIKYIPLVWWKRMLKAVARLDVIGIKRWITKLFGLQRTVHAFFNSEENTSIIKLSLSELQKHEYYHLILIARKQ